ncbi:hypothetical protein BTO01_29420 [Vibrio jasicida]|uniref:hypothetical protein n=1 Tax=Vibrio jasicida TaxID=766224 RepID=UPI000CF49496|nr:hypothetical protein [Vibrio jasicida]PQJ44178.1 hypothetical protein BTO01_29420 [Vibrio jasicida]
MQTRWLMCSLAGVLVGCQTPPEPVSAPPPLNVRIAPDLSAQPAVYTSRYVTERPAGANMTDILGVPVEARLPVMSKMSVKDGMEFLLSGSGVSLRTPTSYAESELYAQPLPLGQTDMGHMSLRQALQVMGGQAFVLEEDVVRREVGFRLKYGYVWQAPKAVKGWSASAHRSPTPQSAKPSTESSASAIVMTPQLRQSLAAQSSSNVASSSSTAAKAATSSQQTMLAQSDDLFGGGASTQPSRAKTSGSKASTATRATPVKKAQVAYRVHAGESYRSALTRWAYKDGNRHLAFAQDEAFLDTLEEKAAQDFVKTGSLARAVAALSASQASLSSLTLYPKPSLNLVAFHPWRGERVTTLMVTGKTLQAAVKSTTEHYDWHWDTDASWTVDDYPFSAYPLVTREGDISAAMTVLLKPYPLKAQRLDATKTLYIKEATPL